MAKGTGKLTVLNDWQWKFTNQPLIRQEEKEFCVLPVNDT